MMMEIDEDHLQLLSRNFQDNLQEALISHTDMFITSVDNYVRYCNFGSSSSENSEKCDGSCVSTSEMTKENSRLDKELECAHALINILRSSQRVSKLLAVTGRVNMKCHK